MTFLAELWPAKTTRREPESTVIQNVYAEIEGNRQSAVSDTNSGHYACLDANAPQPYVYNVPYHGGSAPSPPQPRDMSQGPSGAPRHPLPVYEHQLPKFTPQANSYDNVYAQPKKAKKLKLTSQSSGNSETQMVENDVYNRI